MHEHADVALGIVLYNKCTTVVPCNETVDMIAILYLAPTPPPGI